VSGVVRSALTGGPIADVSVILKQGASIAGTAATGTDGFYSFDGVAADEGYTVEGSSSIYHTSATAAFNVSGAVSGKNITLERNWPSEGTLVAGTPEVSGSTSTTLFNPTGLAFGQDGTLYIAEYNNHTIRTVVPGINTISNYAGILGDAGSADGAAAQAKFTNPFGLCFGPNNTLYVAENGGHRIRKITGDGSVSKFAGTGDPGGSLTGNAMTTALNRPIALTFIGDNLYFTNRASHYVQRIADGTITTIAGTGQPGSTGVDGSPAVDAQVNAPRGIAAAPDGSLYFTEAEAHKVRKIDMTTGNIYHIAGRTDGNSGDGVNELYQPNSIALDAAGTLYIADTTNHRIVVVRNGASSVLTGGSPRGSGNNQLYNPQGLTIGPDGYLYVADSSKATLINSCATILLRLWVRNFAQKPRQTPSLAAFLGIVSHPKYLQSCLPLVNQCCPNHRIMQY
jgi:sugar lactone lactonase YvrE